MVLDAKYAETDGRLVSFMFDAWKRAEAAKPKNDYEIQSMSFECSRADFVKFVNQFKKLSSDKAADIFMHYLREGSQLKVILRQISDTLSPKNRDGIDFDDTREMDRTGGRFGTNDFGGSPERSIERE